MIASKGSTLKGYHPGKVTAIQGEPMNRLYSVRFEDGTTNQVPITKMVLMPKAPYDGNSNLIIPFLSDFLFCFDLTCTYALFLSLLLGLNFLVLN